METSIWYVVQFWVEKYKFWGTTAEPQEGMFALPISQYETEKQGRTRLAELQAAAPETQYRLARITQTIEVI